MTRLAGTTPVVQVTNAAYSLVEAPACWSAGSTFPISLATLVA
jgi:hypothetical protein